LDYEHKGGVVQTWIRRYGPPEIAGTIVALMVALVLQWLHWPLLGIAVTASTSETIGYYGYMAAREVRQHYQLLHNHDGARRHALAVAKTARDLAVEFGPAELVDSLLVRPALMYALPVITGSVILGVLLGKLLSDVVFYPLAIVCCKLKKRWFYQHMRWRDGTTTYP
jgi:hypothetical protein